jgi:hypothetical protein
VKKNSYKNRIVRGRNSREELVVRGYLLFSASFTSPKPLLDLATLQLSQGV